MSEISITAPEDIETRIKMLDILNEKGIPQHNLKKAS